MKDVLQQELSKYKLFLPTAALIAIIYIGLLRELTFFLHKVVKLLNMLKLINHVTNPSKLRTGHRPIHEEEADHAVHPATTLPSRGQREN